MTRLLSGARWMALTGAGMSTDSGIPDYRGPNARPSKPMMFDEFTSSEAQRRRYWARAMVGWPTLRNARPNDGHRALARLSAAGLTGILTQNVDGLHQAAGSEHVIELHGTLARVRCLRCGTPVSRDAMLQALESANPQWREHLPQPVFDPEYRTPERLRPDGDAEVQDWHWVRLVTCGVCGGILKPDVVFFGETVPADRVRAGYAMVDDADVVVVAGSSLTVMSGLRFVRYAAKQGKPIVIINRGPTRGDELAQVRLEAGTSAVLSDLVAALP